MMGNNKKEYAMTGVIGLAAFAVWTVLLRIIDVQPIGMNGTDIGFATFNRWFHCLTGVHMTLYTITDWMGIVPLAVCTLFAVLGLVQLIKRKKLSKVDKDIIILGAYYIVVILAYSFFEIVPINYRPVLIEGVMEASYPSSTTLLVLSVMPTLAEQLQRRLTNAAVKRIAATAVIAFSVFMVIGRLVSGVHWFTDIVGGVLLSLGLFAVYRAAVIAEIKKTQ